MEGRGRWWTAGWGWVGGRLLLKWGTVWATAQAQKSEMIVTLAFLEGIT